MTRSAWVYGALIVCVLAATGCATVEKVLPFAGSRETRARNEGYSLLYRLMSQESDAGKLLAIKHAPSQVADLVNGIASTCGQAKKELELFHEKDRHLNLEMTNLPEIEQKTRAAIESTETKQLLFSSGKKFEVRFLFTQAQAMNYAAHLAKVLHDQEDNPDRKKSLATLSERCAVLHDRAMDLLK